MRLLFQGRSENESNCVNLIRFNLIEEYRFHKMFLVKFYRSCVDFGDLKRGTCVFRVPNYGCLCS